MALKFSLSKIFEKLGAKEVVHHSNDDSIEIRMDMGATVKFNDSADALKYALQQDMQNMQNDANRQRSEYMRAMAAQADPAMSRQLMQDYQQFVAQAMSQSGTPHFFHPGITGAGSSGVIGVSPSQRNRRGPLTPTKELTHPMVTPPLFKPFSGTALFGNGAIAMLETKPVQFEEVDDSDAWPAKTEAPWTVEYGQIHKAVDVGHVTNMRPPIVIGISPLTIAWYVRLVYTAVQCDQSLPQTLEMVQLAGAKKLETAIRALPGIGGEAYLGVTNHLMFGTQPWCRQFQKVLAAALRPGPIPELDHNSVDDQRVVYIDRNTTMPLLTWLRMHDELDKIRTVSNMVAFWREAHPVAMNWRALD